MWWAGRTGTWRWTTSGDRTGLKTTWTAPSSWTHSATSSTSSPLSTAWPTSGSARVHPFTTAQVSPDPRRTHTTSALCSKFLWEGSQRVGVSTNKNTDLGYSAFTRPDGSVVLIVLNRYRKCDCMYSWDVLGPDSLSCRSSSEVQFEVWDPSVGYMSTSAPAHSLLTLAWKTP